MPTVVNGIGTWYYGRRNLRRRLGVCEHCGRQSRLASFDSTLFFVVLYVPLIPLRKVRVLDVCPACSQHRVLSLRDWNRARNTDVVEAVLAVEKSPRDADVAKNALAMCILFQDESALQALARLIEEHQAGNTELMLMLGEGYEYFGAGEDAERIYRVGMELQDSEMVRKRLGSLLIRSSRVDDGMHILARFMASETLEEAAWGYIAVEGLQAEARHEEAAAILRDLETRFPQLARDKSHRSTWKSVRKGLRSGRKIVSPLMEHGATIETRDRCLTARLPWLIGPAVALIGLSMYLWVAYDQGQSRTIVVLNGLDRAYTVEIGGVKTNLPAGGLRRVKVREGLLPVQVTSPGFDIPAHVVDVRTMFWSRPFINHTIVVNPDRTALVVWEETAYSQSGNATSRNLPRLYAGEPLLMFTGLDYAFEEFPATLKVSANVEYRERIYRRPLTLDLSFGFIAHLGHDDAAELLKRMIVNGYEDEVPYGLMRLLCSNDEIIELLRPLLDRRPVPVEHHRLYQHAVESERPEHDLIGEYRVLLQNEPENAALVYLLGRITQDWSEARSLLSAAGEASPPIAHALAALAYHTLSSGEFEAAHEAVRKARALAPHRVSFQDLELNVLHALGRFEDCLASPLIARPLPELSERDFIHRVYYLVRSGRTGEARVEASRFCGVLRTDEGPEYAAELSRLVEAEIAYLQGDEEVFATLLETDDPDNFSAAIARRDVGRALQLIADVEDPQGWRLFAMAAILGLSEGQDAAANQALDRAASLLAAGDADDRLVASWLTRSETPSLDDVVRLPGTVSEKRLLLILIAARHSQLHDASHTLARTLNYDRRFPHLLLKRVVGE
jgi:hypothetical protein